MSINSKIDQTDLTFFTNEEGHTLLSRFKSTLKDTHFFDVLVGYFRASGFYQLYDALEPIEKIRILVGLSIDRDSYDMMQYHQQNGIIDFESHQRTKKKFQANLKEEIENSEENENRLELGIRKFIEFLQTDCQDPTMEKDFNGNGKKLEIRAYPSKNIHAKIYIGKFKPEDRDYGFVITGSSNFSESGFVANREFNVELRTKSDVLFAEDQFNALWKESVDISDDFIDTIQNKTWLNDQILPYELYLKLIYEYLEEDINLADEFEPFLPDGFMKLKYQNQAAIQAKKILETYNGVFLADVVGLGKTFITALLLQQLQGRTLVICPPVLKDYWKDSLFDFGIRRFEVESLGKLEHIIKKGLERYDYIVVDEAHRFRNESTQSYADLLDICRGKKVILVTATPLNNTVDDIFAQLKLFQAPKNSTIPGIPNLEKYFAGYRNKLNKLEKTDPEYKKLIKEVSNDIRNSILRYVMVRRTRVDVMTYFRKDMQMQGLTFPDLANPQKIIYKYEGELETIFNKTIKNLQEFTYARYTPLLFYIGNKALSEFERQQQRNVGGFMKGILVKRLESSFHAFRQSVDRFITSYEKFIEMFHGGTVYISKKVDVYDLIESDNIERLEAFVEDEKAQKYDSKDFRKEFVDKLEFDLDVLREVKKLWAKVDADPKLDQFIHDLKNFPALKKNKLVIFTESRETGNYLYETLLDEFPGKVMFYSSTGGRHSDKKLNSNHTVSRDIIASNFDPKHKEKRDDVKILIATDVLAEGINLHRSNVLINYDLPWNPTRVLQRVGRVNRLGSNFPKVHIFNFFPTTQSDEHLGLEVNITNKIQMFHDILGEDAKYLSDGEEFGSQQLFNTLNSKTAYTGEDGEGDSELKYLEMMRIIRDEQPDLFEKIKNLPKKARSGFKKEKLEADQLVTFFRIGKLKKFYINENGKSSEITFFDAVKELECEPDTIRANIPREYYHLLQTNKTRFELDTSVRDEGSKGSSGRSNANYIENRFKDKSFKYFKGFTDSNDEFINGVKEMLAQGTIAKKTAQLIKNELEKTIDPLQVLHILEKHIRFVAIEGSKNAKKFQKREVILSGYITK
ncbi:helicase-related protein [Geofilum rubicundum]|uniref:Superfamily II DNA/RNA helicases, SNF2 family n=1 Tax=Geofilum rubicundum JCM 15548 TaxID=1236989 RepID=A0A0E9LRV6_9BACT|nr:helicase-related protein [Geofilum rubicundum]GAO28332.1 superfamily II DNA/RNA helicases, SNF2 family [Geofilum rubicundum JCM 15548]